LNRKSAESLCALHRCFFKQNCYVKHIGVRAIFCQGAGGEAVNYLPKKILASCLNFYETVEKKRGPYDATTKAVLAYEGVKVARYCNSFSGSIPPNFEHNYVAIDKHLEQLLP